VFVHKKYKALVYSLNISIEGITNFKLKLTKAAPMIAAYAQIMNSTLA